MIGSTLPKVVLDLVEMSPPEDVALHLLRNKFGSVPVNSLIEDDQRFPLVIVRNMGAWGDWTGDARFLDAGTLVIHTYAEGVNGDVDAALLAEAVRVVLRDSTNIVTPHGYLTKVDMTNRPRRVTDWATASGPVQYADLPTGVWRYETTFNVEIRKPSTKPFQTS